MHRTTAHYQSLSFLLEIWIISSALVILIAASTYSGYLNHDGIADNGDPGVVMFFIAEMLFRYSIAFSLMRVFRKLNLRGLVIFFKLLSAVFFGMLMDELFFEHPDRNNPVEFVFVGLGILAAIAEYQQKRLEQKWRIVKQWTTTRAYRIWRKYIGSSGS